MCPSEILFKPPIISAPTKKKHYFSSDWEKYKPLMIRMRKRGESAKKIRLMLARMGFFVEYATHPVITLLMFGVVDSWPPRAHRISPVKKKLREWLPIYKSRTVQTSIEEGFPRFQCSHRASDAADDQTIEQVPPGIGELYHIASPSSPQSLGPGFNATIDSIYEFIENGVEEIVPSTDDAEAIELTRSILGRLDLRKPERPPQKSFKEVERERETYARQSRPGTPNRSSTAVGQSPAVPEGSEIFIRSREAIMSLHRCGQKELKAALTPTKSSACMANNRLVKYGGGMTNTAYPNDGYTVPVIFGTHATGRSKDSPPLVWWALYEIGCLAASIRSYQLASSCFLISKNMYYKLLCIYQSQNENLELDEYSPAVFRDMAEILQDDNLDPELHGQYLQNLEMLVFRQLGALPLSSNSFINLDDQPASMDKSSLWRDHQIGESYAVQQRYDKALQFLEPVYQEYKAAYGQHNCFTILAGTDLYRSLIRSGKYREAYTVYSELSSSFIHGLKAFKHSFLTLVHMFTELGRYNEALKTIQWGIARLEGGFTCACLVSEAEYCLADVLFRRGLVLYAQPFAEDYMTRCCILYGEQHPETLYAIVFCLGMRTGMFPRDWRSHGRLILKG